MDLSQRRGPAAEVEQPGLHEVVDGIYAWVQPQGTWWVNNAGAVVGSDGVIIVDTCATERRTRSMLSAVARAADGAPITFAVNTHQHGDHTYGNSLLPQSTVVIAHSAARAALMVDPVIEGCPPFWHPVPDWGAVSRRLPTLTVDTRLALHSGGRVVELSHPGWPAHTSGDLVAWLPQERVLFAGDLVFHGVTPLVFMGSVEGARRSLEWISAFDPLWVVPGHGPLLPDRALANVLALHDRYFQLIGETALSALRNNMSPLQAARMCQLGEFADLADPERLVLNLHRAFADALGQDMDILAAFSDAVSLNGGPLGCVV